MSPGNPWYVAFRECTDARLTLYCLPCAGGGPSMFRSWAAHLPDSVALRAVRLPGRPGRHREVPFTDVDEAIAALLAGLVPELTRPFAFVGHSMGAMLAYRLTAALWQRGAVLPRVLAVASWPPNGAAPEVMPDPTDDDETFTAALRRLDGIPQELLDSPPMLRLALPLLRADFLLCRGYTYRPSPPMPVPLIAFGGSADAVTPPGTLAAWCHESTDFRGLHLRAGEHFFLNDHIPALTELIVLAALEPAAPSH